MDLSGYKIKREGKAYCDWCKKDRDVIETTDYKLICKRCGKVIPRLKEVAVLPRGDAFGFVSAINMSALDKASASKKKKVMKMFDVNKETKEWD